MEIKKTTFYISKIALITALFAANPSHAVDFWSPRTGGLAGAGRAGPLLNDAILMNPSFVAFLVNRVSASVAYETYDGPDEGPHGRQYQVALQDGRSPLFSAGVSYTQREGSAMLHVGAARSFVKRTGFGIGGKFLFFPGSNTITSDTTASMTWAPYSDLQLALVFDNLFESELGRSQGLYREASLGLKYNLMGIVLLYFDPQWIPSLPQADKSAYALGTEFVLASDLFLRFGMGKNTYAPWIGQRGETYGAGIGWLAPRISFDFGVARTTAPIASTSYNFGATIYF